MSLRSISYLINDVKFPGVFRKYERHKNLYNLEFKNYFLIKIFFYIFIHKKFHQDVIF